MSTLASNLPYVPESVDVLRDYILTDVRLAARADGAAEPATQPGTDLYRWAESTAQAQWLLFHNISLRGQNTTPLEAEGAELEEWREALGLPVVQPSPASGQIQIRVVTGTVTIAAGTQLVLPNGLRIQVNGTHAGIADLALVDVVAIDTGTKTNAVGGTVVRFVNPPLNVQQEARVATGSPLTGGYDTESDARKRDRILNRLRNLPAGGNWGYVRELAFNASPAVQQVYVYPALGGPASVKVAVAKDYDPAIYDFSRAPSTALLQAVTSAIYAKMPDEIEIIVQGVADSNVDFSVLATLPDSSAAGGSGTGWIDATPWPVLEAADNDRVTISALPGGTAITVTAQTATSPVAGQTHIAVWLGTDRKFVRALVTAVSGSAGAWVLTLDSMPTDHNGATCAVGDFVCPDAVGLDDYAATWLQIMRTLGAGENTADANRLPRSKRHPFVTDSNPSDLNTVKLTEFLAKHAEISDAEYGYRSLSAPAVPGSVATAPNVLRLRRFAVYGQ